jgi:hypothetical protein
MTKRFLTLLTASLSLMHPDDCPAREGSNEDEALVGSYTLPDPLHPAGAQPVKTPGDWHTHGRAATQALFEKHVYGQTPAGPWKLDIQSLGQKKDALGGKATRHLIQIRLANVPAWPGIQMMVYTPNAATGPVPAFLCLSFGGNHAASTESDVPLSDRWQRSSKEKGVENNRATESSRGTESSRFPFELVTDRGYALVTAYCGDIEPDHAEGWKDGVRGALGVEGKPGEWGCIGAWAWGLSRMLDALEKTVPAIDSKRCATVGHSRLGKASLWAGAQDTRFALVISNNSGEGGAALKYRHFGETPAIITKSFPHWFTSTYATYGPDPKTCPVDQHQLIALVAPRPVYVASATEDLWADPKGEFLAAKNAEPVYALFGKAGLTVETQPSPDTPVGDHIGYHLRTGKHDINAYDWTQYLNFADRHYAK